MIHYLTKSQLMPGPMSLDLSMVSEPRSICFQHSHSRPIAAPYHFRDTFDLVSPQHVSSNARGF